MLQLLVENLIDVKILILIIKVINFLKTNRVLPDLPFDPQKAQFTKMDSENVQLDSSGFLIVFDFIKLLN